jgi:hypothetical protein
MRRTGDGLETREVRCSTVHPPPNRDHMPYIPSESTHRWHTLPASGLSGIYGATTYRVIVRVYIWVVSMKQVFTVPSHIQPNTKI